MDKSQKKAIKEWLKDRDGKDICPFTDVKYDGMYRCEAFCKKWFPKVKAQLENKKEYTGCLLCPCQAYSVKYVRKVAKELIK